MTVGRKLLIGSLLALLAIVWFSAQGWLTYRLFTSRFPGANDFLARWAPGCALLWYGENPYSEQATLRAQLIMHGRPAQPGEDHAPFFYPLYALVFVAPFCLTQNYPLAQAYWMTTLFFVLVAGTLLTLSVTRWRPPACLWAFTLLWTALNYPHARAVLLGQFNLLVFLGVGLTLFFLARHADLAAGACLVITTVKPQLSFMVIAWLLWWTACQRRWRFWVGFALVVGVAAGVCFLVVPSWMGDFVRQVVHYDELAGTTYHSLTWIMVRHFLGAGPPLEAVVIAGFLVAALVISWRYRLAQGDGMLWATAMVLLLTQFVAPRVATTGYAVLLFALFLLFRRWTQSMGRHWLALVVQLALLVGQWALFLATIEGNVETAAVYLLFPVPLLVALVLDRPSTNTDSGS